MRPTFHARHRRPSRITHRADLEAEFYRRKTPNMPPDGDTFYYNQAFVCEWEMPADLWVRLPSQLTSELKAWQAAGAAVMTVLARYDNLELEALYRGWPEKMTNHLSRTTSYASPTLQSPISPALGSLPEDDVDKLPSLMAKLGHVRPRKDSTMPAALDTPPFTPQDSFEHEQAIYEAAAAPVIHDKADLDQVNCRLADMARRTSGARRYEQTPSATPSSRRGSAQSHTPMAATFDEAAWDVYINSCKAELEHLRSETLVRFRHLGRGIDRLWTDLKNDSSQHILKGASVEFVHWWRRMTEKAQEFESEAKALELPELEEVKLERIAQGLPV